MLPHQRRKGGLSLTKETDFETAEVVTILDAAMTIGADQQIDIAVHDKRTDRTFDAAAFRKYPPNDTLLQPKVAFLIVFSQCHRTHTIASSIPTFAVEIAAVIHELLCQGHPIKPLLNQHAKCLRVNRPLYPSTVRNPNNAPEYIYNITRDRVRHTWAHGLPRLEHRNKKCGFPDHLKVKKGQQLHWVPFEEFY